ncbi:uncharacterized protein LOC120331409 [Styela clava]
MKVIVAGYPKTGTKSMNWALTRLGYKVYDYPENVYLLQKEYKKIFTQGWTTEDFRRMYENVDAVVDIPAFYFWEEIHKAFPDAKIILTLRDSEEEWFQSMKNLVDVGESNIALRALEILSPTQRKTMRDVTNYMGPTIMGIQNQSSLRRKAHLNGSMLKLKYRNHNSSVLQRAPKDKLLVYKCSEGWEPLCKFLGVPVPKEPFPHKNKAGNIVGEVLETNEIFLRMQRELLFSSIAIIAGSITLGYYTYKLGPLGVCKGLVESVTDMYEKFPTFW